LQLKVLLKNNIMQKYRFEAIFHQQLSFGVFFLKLLGKHRNAHTLFVSLEAYEDGTLGKEIWKMLRTNKYELVPYYEKHDLKHVLLNYPQTAGDEMRMQAFMFGNAGFKLPMVLISIIFVIWTPEVWLELPYHYRVGQLTKAVGGWKIEDFGHRSVSELRQEIGLSAAHEQAKQEFKAAFEQKFLAITTTS
jgi:Coenzyme Q (ubiquinone) biosynthesis protein Coq4